MPTDLRTLTPSPKCIKHGPFSVEAPGFQHVEGETIPRRNIKTKDKLRSRVIDEVATIPDILKYASAKYGNAKAVGSRKLIKAHNETKKIKKMVDGQQKEVDKTWTYFELSGYEYMSFVEFERLALQLGSGLRKLGLQTSDKIHIFAATSSHWLATAHGAMSQSMPIVTAYDTLGEEGLTHSLAQTRSKAIFLDPQLLPKLLRPLKTAKDIQHIIYDTANEVKQDHIDNIKKEYPHVNILSFEDVRQMGESNPVERTSPQPEDLCCVMYTSGSTGAPKGVLLKHSNVVAAIAGADTIMSEYLGPGDGLLTYLPLAHIFEFVFENAVMFWGGTMGYGNPKTLSDASVRNCKGDIREFRPTVLIGVPSVWETVKKGIIGKVTAGNMIVKNMFWGSMLAKTFLMGAGLPGSGLLDSVVFSKVKDATGGRLRICLNGGGPIAKDTQRFISMVIAPMINGYGLTETSAMGALMDPLSWTDTALGEVPGAIEIKLVDFEDAGYFAKNNPPQGEIWIRGPSVTDGYLDLEKENQESFTEDGWFKTGDIGEFDPKGNLKIIDRKKNLVKTLTGEYIALEKLESIYRSATVVANICVYAAPDKSKPIAIIVPAEPALKKLASELGIKGDHLEEMVSDSKLNSTVLEQMQIVGRKGGLASFEIIEGVVLADEEWTPQNGYVTAAQKINRKGILQKYQKEVDRAYGSS